MNKIKKFLSWAFDFFVLNSLRPQINKFKMRFGILLILIGAVLLLQNIGLIQPEVWRIVWPLLIIAIGLMFVLGPKKPQSNRRWPRWLFNEGRSHSKEK